MDLFQIPDAVQNSIITSPYYENAFEYHEVNTVYTPDHKLIVEYYDLSFDPLYEVLYTKDKQTFKVLLNSKGEELKTVELITWKNAPKHVKHVTNKMKFSFWLFDHYIEKNKLADGTYCYKLYATEFGNTQMLMVNKK